MVQLVQPIEITIVSTDNDWERLMANEAKEILEDFLKRKPPVCDDKPSPDLEGRINDICCKIESLDKNYSACLRKMDDIQFSINEIKKNLALVTSAVVKLINEQPICK